MSDDVQWEGQRRRRSSGGGPEGVSTWVVALAGAGLLASALLFFSRPTPPGEPIEGVPRELAGRWVARDPRYAGRVLVVERDRLELVLDLGSEGHFRYPIKEVRSWEEDGGRSYLVIHDTPEGEQTMEIHVEQDGTARLRNPPDVTWTREP